MMDGANDQMDGMIRSSDGANGTATSQSGSTKSGTVKTMNTVSDVESDLGTLIINDESDEEDGDRTLKPAFIQHFERTRELEKEYSNHSDSVNKTDIKEQDLNKRFAETTTSAFSIHDSLLQHNQVQAQTMPVTAQIHQSQSQQNLPSTHSNQTLQSQQAQHQPMSSAIMLESDFEFLRFQPLDELRKRMANLDYEIENEIEEFRRRYVAKRQPILDAIDTKRKRQQNF